MRVLLKYGFGFQTLNFTVHMCSVIPVVSYFGSESFKVMVNHGCGCQTGRWKKKMQPCIPCTVYSVPFGGL